MKRAYLARRIAVAALAACLFAMTAVGVSVAYYTDTSSASGSMPVSTTPDTTITEEFVGNNKHIVIHNEEGKAPVVVRVKYVAPSGNIAEVNAVLDAGWIKLSENDEWIYYAQPLLAGEPTSELVINVTPSKNAPISFYIPVIQQYAPAYYKNGTLSADFGNETVSVAAGN